jgi:hypothetical protein
MEFYENQQKTQEIPSSEKKTPQSLTEQTEQPKPAEPKNPIKVNQGAEVSPQKSEKVAEIPVNPGTTENSNTNGGGENTSSNNN